MSKDTDVRHVLPTIRAPTLVMHFVEDLMEPVEESRYIAQRTPGAILLEASGEELKATLPHVDRFLAAL